MKRHSTARALGGELADEAHGPTRVERRILRKQFYLHPGKIFASAEPTAVTTILGSCVAVCLWDPAVATGGVAHFVLPRGAGDQASALRYGNVAVPQLVQRLIDLGCSIDRLRAKLFGGACVIAAFQRVGGQLGLGNAESARGLLAAAGVPVLVEDLGGRRGRKLIFQVDDGTAWVKFL
jgi:chemotaxis protein CheD